MPFLGESQRHTLQDIGELLLELHQLIDAQSKSIAKFGQQSLTEEAPNSLDARSSQQPTWHTRPPDVQPTTSQESAGRWRPPPSLTVADITSLEALEAQPYMRTEAPLFNGDDPLGWIFGIQAYFNYFFTDESVRLAVVEKLIEQPASDWFYYYQQTNVDGSWEDFLVAVHHRFAPELIEDDVLQVIDENQLVAQSSNKESKNIVTNGISSQTMICDGSSETNRKDAYKFDDIVVNTIFDYGDIVVKAGDIVINDAFDSGQPTCAMEIGEINEVDSFICIDSSKSYSELGCLSVEAELQLPNCIMDDGNSQVETRHIRGVSGDAAGLLDLYGDARTIPPRDTFPNRECGEADDDDHQRLTERDINQSNDVIISEEWRFRFTVEEFGGADRSNNRYELRKNPTRFWRISDLTPAVLAKTADAGREGGKKSAFLRDSSGYMRHHSIKKGNEVQLCKECDRIFESTRTMFDLTKGHYQRVMLVFSIVQCGGRLSDKENFRHIRRKRIMIKYKGTMNPSFLGADSSHCGVFELDEPTKAARRSVMLSNGVGSFKEVWNNTSYVAVVDYGHQSGGGNYGSYGGYGGYGKFPRNYAGGASGFYATAAAGYGGYGYGYRFGEPISTCADYILDSNIALEVHDAWSIMEILTIRSLVSFRNNQQQVTCHYLESLALACCKDGFTSLYSVYIVKNINDTDPPYESMVVDECGLQEIQISDNFAKLSKALYITEQNSEEADAAVRSKVQKETTMMMMTVSGRTGVASAGGTSMTSEMPADDGDNGSAHLINVVGTGQYHAMRHTNASLMLIFTLCLATPILISFSTLRTRWILTVGELIRTRTLSTVLQPDCELSPRRRAATDPRPK